MFLNPVGCQTLNLHFPSLVGRMTPLPSRSRPSAPSKRRPLLQPQRLAELRDPGPTGSCQNYVFRILAGSGWAPDRRLHINASGKLRLRGEKDPVRHFQAEAKLTVAQAHDQGFLVEGHVISVVSVNHPRPSRMKELHNLPAQALPLLQLSDYHTCFHGHSPERTEAVLNTRD